MGAIRSGAAAAGGSGGGGEIVQIHGGHILRSTGRKDRHSKVFTAKGPRDRRVRLAAHTAIQFYDVQDRLGYDRPSKAVDWLIQNAKSAIDKLTELPPWQPNPNPIDTHLLETPPEEPESSDFVPETEPIDRVVSSRSQDLGLSLYPNQTSLGPGLGFGFEREELLYSNNSKLWNLDGFGGPVSEDLHHKSIVQQSLFLGGTFGSDGFAGFSLPVHSHDEGEHVGSSRVPSSLYAWSNGGLHSLLKNK